MALTVCDLSTHAASSWTASATSRIRPRLELGGRWDGGSDAGGVSSELGGGVSLVHVGLGLELAGAGRYLLAHQAEGFEEWRASLTLRAGAGGCGRDRSGVRGCRSSRSGARRRAGCTPSGDRRWTRGSTAHPAASPVPSWAGCDWRQAMRCPQPAPTCISEATRETYGPRAEPNLRVELSATLDW